MKLDGINLPELDHFLEETLREDVGSGDHTSNACIEDGHRSTAYLLVKDVGMISGVQLAAYIFKHKIPESVFQMFIPDGKDVKPGDIVFEVEAPTLELLKWERNILNIMQRMSGITTLANRYAVEVEGLPVKILDTRKTTPRFRFIEKWAVRIGGCNNYRNGLYDWIMIKDNHIDACGSVDGAVNKVQTYLKVNKLYLKITVEIRNLVELYALLNVGGVDRIMLDNFEVPIMREAVNIINKRFEVEASGGIVLQNVRAVAKTGVDFISVGSLTHSAGCLDLSLKVRG